MGRGREGVEPWGAAGPRPSRPRSRRELKYSTHGLAFSHTDLDALRAELGALVPWSSTDPGTSPSGWAALFELAGLAGMAFSAAFAAVSYFTGVLAEVERLP
jgi:hypothetical protein